MNGPGRHAADYVTNCEDSILRLAMPFLQPAVRQTTEARSTVDMQKGKVTHALPRLSATLVDEVTKPVDETGWSTPRDP